MYAPNIDADRKRFFLACEKWFTSSMVMCGDFNVAPSRIDVGRYNTFKSDVSRLIVQRWVNEYGLVHAWRGLKGGIRGFSRRQLVLGQVKQSCIDLCFMTLNLIQLLSHCEYNFWGSSDHAALKVILAFRHVGRNGGVWCFNSALIRDEGFRARMMAFRKSLKEECEFVSNVAEWWERAKRRIRHRAIVWSSEKKGKDRAEEAALQNRMDYVVSRMEGGEEDMLPEFLKLRQELSVVAEEKYRGAMTRGRVQHMLEGEHCTAYFLGLEKRRQSSAYVHELVDEYGGMHTDLLGILETAQSYYERLYARAEVAEVSVSRDLAGLSACLDSADAEYCDGSIVLDEIRMAIGALNAGKSPGEDELTAEFYRCFEQVLSPILLRVFLFMQEQRWCSELFVRGVILSSRLKNVVGTVVGPEQMYGVPGRDILECVLSTRLSLDRVLTVGGVFLKVDLEKAFDNVSHEFLSRCLRALGFGAVFCGWIELLYGRAMSVVKCNGSLSDPFTIEKLLRQGCPLPLYAISTEPLARAIIEDQQIRGIQGPGLLQYKLALYADDVNIMVRDDHSFRRVLGHLQDFERASGAIVNRSKSCVIVNLSTLLSEGDGVFYRERGPVKVLGIYMGGDVTVCANKVWAEQLSWCRVKLQYWRNRTLGLKGRVLVVNAIIVPKLVYALQICPLTNAVLSAITGLINGFLWRSKAATIAHGILIGPVEKGGLGLVDLRVKLRSCPASWTSRLAMCGRIIYLRKY